MGGKRVYIALVLVLSCMLAGADAEETLVVDIGASETTAMRGFGWRRQNERIETNTFCWIEGLEADLHIKLDVARNYKVAIFARAFYYDNCKQRFALFVNNNFVEEWTCAQHPEWTFDRYSAIIPSDYLIAGLNRFTIRSSYASETGDPGLSLAVDRLLLRSVDEDSGRGRSALIRLLVFAVLLTMLGLAVLKYRMR